MVVGDRETHNIEHFSPLKKSLQRLGSAVVRRASDTDVPDTTSGFRAYNREAAIQLAVVSKFTYTLETIIQAGKLLVATDHVPVATNPQLRESRLFGSMWAYVRRNSVSIFRIYAQYEPLRVFMTMALLVGLGGRGRLDALDRRLDRRLGLGPRAVADPRRGAVQRRGRARGARRDRRPAVRAARDDAAHVRARAAHRAAARHPAVALRAGRAGRARADHRRARRPDHRGTRGSEALTPSVTVDREGTVTGNTFDKYGSNNPVVKRLMANFEGTLEELFRRASPASLLDVGCGEGVLTHKWAQRIEGRVVGLDLDDPQLHEEWKGRQAPNLEYRVMKAENLPFADDEFDVATAIEVLEHVPDPEHTVSEMARVASGHLLVSVPREPLWRGLNMARGAYLRDLGNTPGHVNHWSKRGFVQLLERYGTVEEARSPFPWTMLLVRVG